MPINPSIRMLAAVATLMLCLLFTAKAQAQMYTTDVCGDTVMACESSVLMYDTSTCNQNRSRLLGSVRQRLATIFNRSGERAQQRQQARAVRRSRMRSGLCG